MQLDPANHESDIEQSLQSAMALARDQGSISWELSAAVSLARFWRKHGKQAQANSLLRRLLDQFSEGFDSPVHLEAAELLGIRD